MFRSCIEAHCSVKRSGWAAQNSCEPTIRIVVFGAAERSGHLVYQMIRPVAGSLCCNFSLEVMPFGWRERAIDLLKSLYNKKRDANNLAFCCEARRATSKLGAQIRIGKK